MTLVVKAGGSVGVDREAVAIDIAALALAGERVVLVHGASSGADTLAEALGHPPRTVMSPSGQQSRRTDRRTLEIFAMAALGDEMVRYVELLRRHGARPVGIFGALGGTRKNVRAVEAGRTVILRDDYTGRVERVDAELLWAMLRESYVPVLPPLALSGDGCLNVDGDRAAAAVAAAIGASTLVILTNVPGVLRSTDDPASVVADASADEIDELATGRMKKKALAAREALAAGVVTVRIASGAIESPVRRALGGGGTMVTDRAAGMAVGRS